MGTFAKAIMIGKAVFFPVFLNTLQGMRGVSKDYIEVGRVFEYKRVLLFRKVHLDRRRCHPFSSGCAMGRGWHGRFVIAADMLGGRYGLGYLLLRSQEMLLTSQVFVVIVVIGAVGFAVDLSLAKNRREPAAVEEEASKGNYARLRFQKR